MFLFSEAYMKSTGIVRPLDSLGRIVLPIELRRTMGLACKDEIEIFVEGDSIVLKKYAPNCIFCGSKENLISLDDKCVCKACVEKLNEL